MHYISCPENVNLYNRFMGGVDMADQLRGYYHVRMKCRKVLQVVKNVCSSSSDITGVVSFQVHFLVSL